MVYVTELKCTWTYLVKTEWKQNIENWVIKNYLHLNIIKKKEDSKIINLLIFIEVSKYVILRKLNWPNKNIV